MFVNGRFQALGLAWDTWLVREMCSIPEKSRRKKASRLIPTRVMGVWGVCVGGRSGVEGAQGMLHMWCSTEYGSGRAVPGTICLWE